MKYSYQEYKIAAKAQIQLEFCEALAGTCNEFFVGGCKLGGNDVKCIDVLAVYPNL